MDLLEADNDLRDDLQILKSLYYAPVAQKKMHAYTALIAISHAIAQNFMLGEMHILTHKK